MKKAKFEPGGWYNYRGFKGSAELGDVWLFKFVELKKNSMGGNIWTMERQMFDHGVRSTEREVMEEDFVMREFVRTPIFNLFGVMLFGENSEFPYNNPVDSNNYCK